MAFAERPFYLLPSRSPRFYLGLVIFFPLQIVPEKQELCFLSLQRRQGKRVGSVWEAII